jgi:EmrB/QacA subfamily drug resistance transporter
MSSDARPGIGTPAHVAKQPDKWAVFAVVAIGVLMATLDASIVNISLPSIGRSFERPLSGAVQWVVIGYLVVIVALLLSAGRLGDLLGRKLGWQIGLVAFTLGSGLCGFAPSLGGLIGFRALQGVGAALLMALSPALLTTAFPRTERGRALGMNALVVAIGVSLGPPLGGIITERLSWRWIFFINLPLGVAGVVLTGLVLPRVARRAATRFDVGGALLLGVALASLTGALSFAHDRGWTSPLILGGLVLAACTLGLFLAHEARQPDPLVDIALFRHAAFSRALASLVLSFVAMFGVAFLTPFYLEDLRGLSTEQSGLLMLAFPLTLAVVAPLAGSVSDRVGSRVLVSFGLALGALALLLLGSAGARTPLGQVALYLAIAGLGQALFQPANNSALLGAAPPERQGVAGGLLATGRVLGQSLSVALSGAVFAGLGGAEAGQQLAARPASRELAASLARTFVVSFRAALWACAGCALLGVLLTLLAFGKPSLAASSLRASAGE